MTTMCNSERFNFEHYMCVGDAFCGASTAEDEVSGGSRGGRCSYGHCRARGECVCRAAGSGKGMVGEFYFPCPLPPLLRYGRQTPVGFE